MKQTYCFFSTFAHRVLTVASARAKLLTAIALCLFSVGNVWGKETAVYTVTSTSSVSVSDNKPNNSSASYQQTYTNTKCQITKDNSATLTLSGYDGYKITGITLSMHSNKRSGAGTFSVKAGSTTLATISSATNFNKWFDNNSYGTSYRDVHVALTNSTHVIGTSETVIIEIKGTTNSLFIQSYTITYEPATPSTPSTPSITFSPASLDFGDVNVDETSTGKQFEITPSNLEYGYYISTEYIGTGGGIMEYSSDAFSSSSDPTSPYVTNYSTKATVTAKFTPATSGAITGNIIISDGNSITEKIPFTANGVAQSTTVSLTQELTHVTCTTTPLPTEIDKTAEEITLSYTATGDYVLPTDRTRINITMGGAAVSNYTWGDGKLKIRSTNGFTGDVKISIYGQLQAPTGLQTSDIKATSAKLTWNEVPNATGYIVSYCDEKTDVKTSTTGVPSYELKNLDPNTYYVWNVKAIDSDSPKTDSEESKVSGDFQTLEPTKYDVTWYVNNTVVKTGSIVEGTSLTATNLPTRPDDNTLTCGPNKFMGWTTAPIDGSTDEKPAPLYDHDDPTKFPPVTANTNYYAVFAKAEGGTTEVVEDITDILTREVTGVPNQSPASYQSWSKKQITSEAMYSGNSAGGNNSIQLRASSGDQAKSGIVSTTSGGRLKKVVVEWNSNTTDGRKLDIYVKVDAYSAVGDLYDQVKRGARVGQIEYGTSTEYILPDTQRSSAKYVGLRSNSGAMWLNSIKIVWEKSSTGSSTTYSNYVTACEEEVCNLSEPSNPLSKNITSSGATLTWNAVTGATGYVVTLTTGGVSKEIPTTDNQCELTELQPATDYTWTVKATKGKCESGSCSIQKFTTLVPCTPLAMPTNVKVEWIEGDQYQLSWDKVTNATCYKITGQFNTASIKQNYTIRTLSDLTRGREYSGTIIAMNPGDYCDSNPADYSFVYKPYTVTFNAGSGTCPVASSEETTIEELPEAQNKCEGWEFVGWSTIPCSETTTLPALVTAPYTPTSDHTLYAVYAKTEEGGQSNDFNSVDVDYGDLVSGEEYVLTAYNNSVNEYALSCNETDISGKYETKQISIVTIDEDNDGEGDFYQLTTADTDIIWRLIGDGTNGYYFKHVATGKCLINDAGNLLLSDTGEPIRFLISHPDATSYRVEVQLKDESKYLSGYKKDDNYGILFNIHTGSTLDLYLYKRTSATIYTYSSNPSCTPCNDAEWYFELGSRVQKIPEAANFTNKLISTNTNPVTYKSSNPSVATVNPTTGEVTIVALGETTITAKQSRSGDICPVVADYLLVVQEPQVEVVEVTPNSIILAHDFEGETEVVMQERVTTVEGEVANDIFFSKYFEAASNMKLLALYNGTDHPIDFRKLRIRVAYNDIWPTGTSNGTIVELGKISDLMAKYPSGMLPQLTEIILWSNNYGNTSGAETNNTDLRNCIDLTINKQQYTYADMEAKRIPNWYCIGDPITFAQKDADGHQQMMFGGDDAISLERQEGDGMWTAIDLIGAGTSGAPERKATDEKAGSPLYMDDKGWYNMEVKLSTNRCLLWRKKGVKDGYTAVKKNVTDFVTLGTEWEGRPVSGDDPYCTSGEMFAELAEFDYAHYFTKFVTLPEDRAGITHNPDGTITVKMDDLTDRACDFLNINVLKKGTTDTIAHTYYKVPIIVQGEKLTNDEIFTKEGTACTTCDVVILNNSSLTKAPEGTAGDITAVRDLEVYAGGKLDLPADCSYQVRSLALRSKEDVVSSATLEGDLKILLDNTYHDKRIQASRWYWITLPQDCPVSNVTFRNGEPAEYGVDWLLKTYDGEQRANTQKGGCWKVFGGTTIKAGVGYILAITPKQGHTYRELRFPMSGYGKAAEHSAKDVPVDDYGAGMDITPNHKGWNLVGNPYLSYYRSSSWDGLTVGQLVENDEYEYELAGTIPYVTIPQNAGYSEYTQEAIGEYDLPPFTSYFVQVGGATPHTDPLAVNFAADGRKTRSVAERRMPAQTADKAVRVTVALANAAGEQDKTTLVMSNRYTDAYEIGADLLKWRGSQYTRYSKPVLASAGQDGELAFHALADAAAQQGVRLHYFAAQQGEYTFSLVQGYDPLVVKEVILYDTETGTSVNLLQQDYRFRSDRQDNKTRFVLSVRVERTPAVTTGIDRLQTGIYAVGEAGALHLFNLPAGSHVRIYDSLGRLVADDDADALQAVYPVGCAGVYNVSVTVAGENQTLRTIVK